MRLHQFELIESINYLLQRPKMPYDLVIPPKNLPQTTLLVTKQTHHLINSVHDKNSCPSHVTPTSNQQPHPPSSPQLPVEDPGGKSWVLGTKIYEKAYKVVRSVV